jgi:hypothetical protein
MNKKSPSFGERAVNSLLQEEFTTPPAETQAPAALRRICIRLAVAAADNSAKKRRIIFLWERGIITAGDVERLFSKYRLKHD